MLSADSIKLQAASSSKEVWENTFKPISSDYILIHRLDTFSGFTIPVGIAGLIVLILIDLARRIFLYITRGENFIRIPILKHQKILLIIFIISLGSGAFARYVIEQPRAKTQAYQEYQATKTLLSQAQVVAQQCNDVQQKTEDEQTQATIAQCEKTRSEAEANYQQCVNEESIGGIQDFTTKQFCETTTGYQTTDTCSNSYNFSLPSLTSDCNDNVNAFQNTLSGLQTQYGFQ